MAKAGTGALFAYNLEILANGPIDGRMVVDSVNDLTSAATWTTTDGKVYIYKGLRTFVKSENKIYVLIDEDYTKADNWIKLIDEIELTEMSEDFDLRITDVVDSLKGTEAGQVLITREDNSELKAKWEVPTSKDNLLFDGTFNDAWPLKEAALASKKTMLNAIEEIVNYVWYSTPTLASPTASTQYKEIGTNVSAGSVTIKSNGKMDSVTYTTFGSNTATSIDVDEVKAGKTISYDSFTGTTTNASAEVSKKFIVNCETHDKDNKKVTPSATITYTFRYPFYIGSKAGNVATSQELVEKSLAFGSNGATTGAKTLAKVKSDVTYFIMVPQPMRLTVATDSGSMNASVLADFGTASVVTVTRNGNAHAYNVYRYHPANAYGNTSNFNLTIA